MSIFRRVLIVVALALGVAFVAATAFVRHPLLIPWRPWLYPGAAGIAFVLALVALGSARHGHRVAPLALIVLAVAGLGSIQWQQREFTSLSARVLATPQEELRAVGRHLIVGYSDVEELKPLVTKAAIAGVFIGKRNAENVPIETIAGDITFLQDLRARNALPPLWIGTDQEGGLVASLSPPLARPRSLSAMAANTDVLREEVTDVARELACLGVNVNFAPVVDLNRGLRDPEDRYSRITDRSISADPAVVAKTAEAYCGILAKAGVQCTLKHFPGLGSVAADTHVREAVLPDLIDDDIKPFRELTRSLDPQPWVMLSHAVVAGRDHAHPASASRAVIDVLRQDWRFGGVLVTDDVWMEPYRQRLADNVIGSLAGGADLILVSFDPDLAYPVLDTLLQARRSGALPAAALQASDERLAARRPAGRLVGCPATFSNLAWLQ